MGTEIELLEQLHKMEAQGPVLKLMIDRTGPANENFHRSLVRLIAKQVIKDIQDIEATEDEVSEAPVSL